MVSLKGLPKNTPRKLQLVQNAVAKVLTKTKKCEHITPILKSLDWLNVGQRIDFKIMSLTYKSLHGFGPTFMLPLHKPSRPLRSSETTHPKRKNETCEGRIYYATNG